MNASVEDRIVGCLLGGAIGDAMGAGIEFQSLAEIRHRYGPVGVTSFVPAYGRTGAITDDTQMTLFTTEGLIRAWVRGNARGVCDPTSVVRNAYLRWYATQGSPLPPEVAEAGLGWLFSVRELHSSRAPGNTCLSALAAGGHGEPDRPINDSKGCGGVMRAAPAGFPQLSAQERFDLGCRIAAITHGHRDGHLPAGFLAVAVGALVDGESMSEALDVATGELESADGSASTLRLVHAAREMGATKVPDPEQVERLGGGWVGHEALAIAVACCASCPDFRRGVLAAVNHSGDSDSTGAIAGNLLGAAGGVAALPDEWLVGLELRDVIEQLGRDAALQFYGEPHDGQWFQRYPGA